MTTTSTHSPETLPSPRANGARSPASLLVRVGALVVLAAAGCADEDVRPFGGMSLDRGQLPGVTGGSGVVLTRGGSSGTLNASAGGVTGSGGSSASGGAGPTSSSGGASSTGGARASGTGGAPGTGGMGQMGTGGNSAVTTAACRQLILDYDNELQAARACRDVKEKDGPVCGMRVLAKLAGCGSSCTTYVQTTKKLDEVRDQWTKAGCAEPVCSQPVACGNPVGALCGLITGLCVDVPGL